MAAHRLRPGPGAQVRSNIVGDQPLDKSLVVRLFRTAADCHDTKWTPVRTPEAKLIAFGSGSAKAVSELIPAWENTFYADDVVQPEERLLDRERLAASGGRNHSWQHGCGCSWSIELSAAQRTGISRKIVSRVSVGGACCIAVHQVAMRWHLVDRQGRALGARRFPEGDGRKPGSGAGADGGPSPEVRQSERGSSVSTVSSA